MKKILALLLVLVMVLSMVACGAKTEAPAAGEKTETSEKTNTNEQTATNEQTGSEETAAITDPDSIADEMTSADGKYQVAFITDVGQLKDKSFNQGTYDGVKLYAANNGKSYKYYQPANGDQATDDDRIDAMKLACENGAEIVVAAGFMQAAALEVAAKAYPEVKFVFIDGWTLGLDNVAAIAFKEEQSGYLAGYAAVMEGYTKLGFCGGGGGTNPACQRFGYGFAQGADAAAAKLGIQIEMNYSWEYGASFSASAELQTMLNGWYTNGTEVIFACGGSMCQSAFAAAGANDGVVIGVDVDQSGESEYVITSAMKGLAEAVMVACDTFYKGEWASVGGSCTTLGAKDDAVGLPTATWSMEKFTVEQYNALFASLKDGSVVVDRDYETGLVQENFANVTLNIT